MVIMDQSTLINIVRSEGRLPVDLYSTNVTKCYAALTEFLLSNPPDLLKKVESLYMPSKNGDPVPIEIRRLKKLRSFTFKGAEKDERGRILRGSLYDLPEDKSNLSNLTYLDISFNDIFIMPDWVFDLKHLKRLQVNFCDIEKISEDHVLINFPDLKEFYAKENLLTRLPKNFFHLQNLEILNLSGNKFANIPDEIYALENLKLLDLSDNKIRGKLQAPMSLHHLEILKLAFNKFETVDPDVMKMTHLKILDLRFNCITQVHNEMESEEFILLDGNPLGEPSPETNTVKSTSCDDNTAYYVMDSDTCCVEYEAGKSAEYELPCGVTITFPSDALSTDMTIYSELIEGSDVDFELQDLDELLSGVLNLSPDGLKFKKPVKISIPYSYERNDEQVREVVIRVMSADGTTEDLETVTRYQNHNEKKLWMAEAQTLHFSKFAAVAKVMEASTVIQKDSAHLLFSPAYPQTKLKFDEGSVSEGTKVTMKVISVDHSIVEEISSSPTAATSCILAVNVFPQGTVFKKPVHVRIALPDKLLGKSFNHKDLRLLKCCSDSTEWVDVTSITPMTISAVDVSFQVQVFCKYVVVKDIVCGVFRYMYRRLRTHKVQFIAMQKRTLPTQILAQCVLEKKVTERIQQLQSSGYDSQDGATEVQEMLEGASFKIKVIGDLKLQTFSERKAKKVQESNLLCKFFSQYPPDKKGFSRFFIEPCMTGKKFQTGFVSFYRESDDGSPVATIAAKDISPRLIKTTKKRKADEGQQEDSGFSHNKDETVQLNNKDDNDDVAEDNHLGDIPIALQGDVMDKIFTDCRPAELDFGGLGTGMFREENLRLLANKIGNEWREIGTYLGIPYARLDQIAANHCGNVADQIFRMLKTWSDLHRADEDCIDQFMDSLSSAGRNDLARKVKELHEEAKKEFHNSVKSLRFR